MHIQVDFEENAKRALSELLSSSQLYLLTATLNEYLMETLLHALIYSHGIQKKKYIIIIRLI